MVPLAWIQNYHIPNTALCIIHLPLCQILCLREICPDICPHSRSILSPDSWFCRFGLQGGAKCQITFFVFSREVCFECLGAWAGTWQVALMVCQVESVNKDVSLILSSSAASPYESKLDRTGSQPTWRKPLKLHLQKCEHFKLLLGVSSQSRIWS